MYRAPHTADRLAIFSIGLTLSLGWLSFQTQLPGEAVITGSALISVLAVAFAGVVHRKRILPGVPFRWLLWLLPLVLGVALGLFRGLTVAKDGLDNLLTENLEGIDLIVVGEISGIPIIGPRSVGFDVKITEPPENSASFPEKIRLRWYRSRKETVPELQPGQRWRMTVRLKRNHGSMTPGVFDQEGWAFRRGTGARGYVRGGVLLGNHPGSSPFASVSQLRFRIYEHLSHRFKDRETMPLTLALAIGDRSKLDKEHWRVLRHTGTSHLMAISGLHIGLVALGCGGLAGFLWRHSGRCVSALPTAHAQVLAAIPGATFYALLADLAIPTQRALVMLVVFAGARLLGRRLQVWRALLLALIIVLIIQPLTVNEVGLWLSFVAVAWLGLLYRSASGVRRSHEDTSGDRTEGGRPVKAKPRLGRRILDTLSHWFRLQLLLTIGLMPFVFLFFNQFSLVSIPANLLAIPITGFVIVPLVLLGVVSHLLGLNLLSDAVFILAIGSLDGLWILLTTLSSFSFSVWERSTPPVWTLVFASFAMCAIFLPRGFSGRRILAIAFAPLLFYQPPELAVDEMEVAVLDVGQGLAIVVRTRDKTLLFDTGLGFPGGLSMADRVILPFLRSRGIRKLDVVVVSHPDNDHAGGLASIKEQMPIGKLFVGPEVAADGGTQCTRGDSWQWQGVRLEFLSPGYASHRLRGNDASCVLRIQHPAASVLLTGDIEARAERVLVASLGSRLKSDILLLGHHGSITSTTSEFLDLVEPKIAIASAGYRNRHGHPAADVLNRLRDQHIPVERTDRSGTIAIRIGSQHGLDIRRYRRILGRYWHHS